MTTDKVITVHDSISEKATDHLGFSRQPQINTMARKVAIEACIPGPHPVHFDQAGDAQDVGACLHLVEIADRQRGGHGLSARRADRFTMDGEGAIGRDGDRCLVTGGCGGRAPYACTIAVTRPTARLASGANPSAPTYWA